jgi:hypothetical protein
MKHKQTNTVFVLADAFQIVISLARQNALDPDHCDPELLEHVRKPSTCLKISPSMSLAMHKRIPRLF